MAQSRKPFHPAWEGSRRWRCRCFEVGSDSVNRRWRNQQGEVVPPSVLSKPPSAELREGQLDSDTLPPYEVLDPIIEAYVENDHSPEEIEKLGFDRPLVDEIVAMIDRAEYKRRQAPPGIRITARAFGKDRRLPITNLYRPASSKD